MAENEKVILELDGKVSMTSNIEIIFGLLLS